jgi:hypothetical protein
MRLKRLLPFVLIVITLTISVFQATTTSGDRGDQWSRNRHRERHRNDDNGRSYLKPVTDLTYKENCGACHFPYQPELLPSASWKNILNRPDDHFGGSFELDEETKSAILNYLQTNAAEHSTAKWAVRIMRSLKGRVPARITEIPCFKEKHHHIPLATIKRQSIGSLSNCTACHTRAQEGDYDDDFVVIPK